MKLQIRNISKSFKLSQKEMKNRKLDTKKLEAVKNLSFEPLDGEIYGLLGPNGAGKTTTLRMIASILKPIEGEILFNDKNINDDINEYRKNIGFLTSELKLDDFFTPDYTFDYMASLYGLNKEEIEKNKQTLFKKFGIDKFRYSKIKELSTGMKQKVSLAISLAHNPNIIIFDEPTNGLDIIASKTVEDFLFDLKKEDKIIIISTHIFSLIEKLADRVGIILDGKLVHEEKISTLKEKNQALEDLFFEVYNNGDLKQDA